jgi:hypothetical protein
MFGFFARADANVVAALIAEKSINGELRSMLAGERARFDWLAAHVNELKLERAALYARIGLDVPVPTIERTASRPLPGADDNYVPPAGHQLANVGDTLARARERRDAAPNPDLAARVLETLAGPLSFEDIGDEAAAALRIEHDRAGNLIDATTR